MTEAEDKPKTKTTQIVEGILFSHVFKHSISVGVDGIHATKRIVQIFGPLVHITDPNKLLPNLFLFLPMWEITPKKSKNHRTLILRSEKVEDINEIKIKTKNIKLLNMLSKQFLVGKECLINQKLRFANHSIRLNKDGAFVPAKYQMSNDYVKVIVGDKVAIDLPRYPDSWAGPNINDYEKVHFYRGDHMTATIKCKDMLQAMKIIVEMNMIPDDLETIPDIFTGKKEDLLVPEIDESAFDNTSGSSIASSAQLSEASAGTDDEDEEEEDEAEDGHKKKKKKSKNEKEIPLEKKKKKKRKGVEAMADFSVRMEEKMDKLKELPRNEKRAGRAECIEKIVSQFTLKVPTGTAPPVTVPEKGPNDNDILPWEMPRSPITSSLFNNQIQTNFPKDITLKDKYNVSQVFQSLTTSNKEAINSLQSVRPNDKDVVPYDEAFENLDKMQPNELPEFVTGVFLHGRTRSYIDLAHSISNINFSCKRIREIFQSTHVKTKKTYYRFFFQLFKEGLAGTFFRSLIRFPYFRLINYYPDSLMRCDDTIETLSKLNVKLPGNTKLKSKPKIPFKLDIYPHIILAHEIPRFQQNQTEIWIDEENQMGPTPMSMIIAACIALMALTYNDREPKIIIYKGQFKKLWKTFKQHSKNLGSVEPEIEALKLKRAHQDTKVVELLLHALVENKLIEFLINFMKCKNCKNDVTQHLILCVSQLEKLSNNFVKDCLKRKSIVKETKNDLIKVFARDPLKKKKSAQQADQNKELLNAANNKINQIVGQIENKTGIKLKKNEGDAETDAADAEEENKADNNENNNNNAPKS